MLARAVMLARAELARLAPPSGGVFTLRGTARERASSSGEDAAAALTG
jgi:hypothetical protein